MAPFLRRMETRRLHDAEMKQLVCTLRGVPQDVSKGQEAKYRRYAKEAIHHLPRRLRTSYMTLHATTLCATHNGLDAHLIDDIWSWLRFELEGAIGRFLYPIIMSSRLSATEEFQVRQLEPVLQMWYRPWSLQQSAPLGHEPIQCGQKWAYQQDQCPACMLSRIGSDTDVLFALFAGMVGHFKTRSLANAGAQGGNNAWKKTKSKRIRFVKHWLRANTEGDAILATAGELGMKMKRLRREWNQEQRRLRREQRLSPRQPGLGHHTSRIITLDRHPADPKIGPAPRPAGVEPFSAAVQLGFSTSASPEQANRHHTSAPRCNGRPPRPVETVSTRPPPSSDSPYTLGTASHVPSEDLYPAPLRPNRSGPAQAPHSPFRPSGSAPRWPCKDELSTLSHDHYHTATGSSPRPSSSSVYSTSPSLASTLTIASYNKYHYHADPLPTPTCPANSSTSPIPLPSSPSWNSTFHSGWNVAPPRRPRPGMAPLDLEDDAADESSMLPRPGSGSVYEAFGRGDWDGLRFESVDEEAGGEDEPDDNGHGHGCNEGLGMEDWAKGKGRVESSVTRWDDFY